MAYDYANDPVWGSAYRRAVASGDQNYIQKLQTAMNNNPAAQGTAGQIMAKTLDQGRSDGANIWANGAAGTQVNGLGQIRTEQPAQGWNVTPGGGGSLYNYQGQQAPAAPSNIIGQAQGTMTQDQYGASQQPRQMYGASPTGGAGSSFDQNTINNFYRKGAPETTKPLAVSQPPQWNPGSVFGQGGQFGGLGALQQILQQMQGGGWGGNPWQQQANYWARYGQGIAPTSWNGDSTFGPGFNGGQQQPDQGMMMDTHGMYRPQQTNWGGGYGSRQGMFNAGPLSQMFNSGWRR